MGKTSLFSKFVDGATMENPMPTLGVEYRTKLLEIHSKEAKRDFKVKVKLWDTAGQERYKAITSV